MSQSASPDPYRAVVLQVRDFVSGAKASLNGALVPPAVGSTVLLIDAKGRECQGLVRVVARVPHDPRGSHWEIDVQPKPNSRYGGTLTKEHREGKVPW